MEKASDAFKTISEVADLLDLPQHVLRFWETRFPQLKPMKRGGGRRYYRPVDIDFLKAVQYLLYEKGYTIKGVQRLLKEKGLAFITALGRGDEAQAEALIEEKQKDELDEILLDDVMPESKEKSESRGFFSFLRGEEDDRESSNVAQQKDKGVLVQQVLLELIECKRLLDRARQE